MQLESANLPLTINGVDLFESEIPASLPTDTHEIDWTGDLPSDSEVSTITGKTVSGYSASDKSNWMNDAIASKLEEAEPNPPDPDDALSQIKAKFVEWAGTEEQALRDLNAMKKDYGAFTSAINQSNQAEGYPTARKVLDIVDDDNALPYTDEATRIQVLKDVLKGV